MKAEDVLKGILPHLAGSCEQVLHVAAVSETQGSLLEFPIPKEESFQNPPARGLYKKGVSNSVSNTGWAEHDCPASTETKTTINIVS